MTTHDITLYYHSETPLAILVGESYMRDDKDHVWLPKSQIDYRFVGLEHGTRQVEITAPEWLLIDKGLEGLV